MNMTEWEEVSVPRGAYISWGNKPGQHVTGKVLAYDITGGTDFAGKSCPSVEIELVESAVSINKDGDRSTFESGEIVQLNAGQVSLKRALRAADPTVGDLVKITLSSLVKSANGTVKEFEIKIARGAGAASSATSQSDSSSDDDPPF